METIIRHTHTKKKFRKVLVSVSDGIKFFTEGNFKLNLHTNRDLIQRETERIKQYV